MFNWFRKNSTKKLEEEYAKKMEEAIHLQRNGDIEGYARASHEAEILEKKIEESQKDSNLNES